MLKIWGRKNSSNVRKALWIAEELGLEYESLNAGGAFGVNDQPEYLAKNPNGVVPMIEDGEFVLWESNTIVRYLAAQYAPDSAFYPASPKARSGGEVDGLDYVDAGRPFPPGVLGRSTHAGRQTGLDADQRGQS